MTDTSPVLSSLLRDQRKIDLGHLKLLSIFHFVGAGLAVFGGFFLLGHYAMFNMFLSNPEMWQQGNQPMPPADFFVIFKWFYIVGGFLLLLSFLLNILSGMGLRKKKWRMLSFIVAAINCLHMPLGTVLGVFTIIVLVRDSVGELYEARAKKTENRQHRSPVSQ